MFRVVSQHLLKGGRGPCSASATQLGAAPTGGDLEQGHTSAEPRCGLPQPTQKLAKHRLALQGRFAGAECSWCSPASLLGSSARAPKPAIAWLRIACVPKGHRTLPDLSALPPTPASSVWRINKPHVARESHIVEIETAKGWG